jgi:hypothetical protein
VAFEQTDIKHKNCNWTYQQHKGGPEGQKNRDFVEKYIIFAENNKFYVYFNSIMDDVKLKDKTADCERCYTYIGVETLERRPSDGKIIHTSIIECDLKQAINPKLVHQMMSGVQESHKSITKYLKENPE